MSYGSANEAAGSNQEEYDLEEEEMDTNDKLDEED